MVAILLDGDAAGKVGFAEAFIVGHRTVRERDSVGVGDDVVENTECEPIDRDPPGSERISKHETVGLSVRCERSQVGEVVLIEVGQSEQGLRYPVVTEFHSGNPPEYGAGRARDELVFAGQVDVDRVSIEQGGHQADANGATYLEAKAVGGAIEDDALRVLPNAVDLDGDGGLRSRIVHAVPHIQEVSDEICG